MYAYICMYMHNYTHTRIYISKSGDIENYYYKCNRYNFFSQEINYSYDLFVIFWRQNFCIKLNYTKIFWQ